MKTRSLMPRKPTIALREGDGKSVIYIETDLARAADRELDELIAAEEKLGRMKNLPQGKNPKVDELYRKMHARHAEVQNMLAREVITSLVGQIDGDLRHLAQIAKDARYDRYACDDGHCPCSPGVVVPGLRRDGRSVAVLVK